MQIKELEDKISRLYQLVEKIGDRVDNISDSKQSTMNPYSLSSFDRSRNKQNLENRDTAYSLSNHKDILLDETSSNTKNASGNEKELSPEIQIRRLTAQLTAAYNRIAALEEQLLTYRIKS